MAGGFVQGFGSRLSSSWVQMKSGFASYVSSLGQLEKYAWLAVGAGFLLIILAIILW